MTSLRSIATMGMLFFALSMASAQDRSTPPPDSGSPQSTATPQQPAPAQEQETPPAPITENPPISGWINRDSSHTVRR